MIRSTRICGWAVGAAILLATSGAWAQQQQPPTDDDVIEEDTDDDTDDVDAIDDDAVEDDEDGGDTDASDDAEPSDEADDADGADDAPEVEPDIPEDVQADPADEADEADDADPFGDTDDEWPDEFDDDAFEDFEDDDIEFTRLDELDSQMLDRITAATTFPHVEWNGQLRTRSQLRYNFDLGTGGTSAVLPPVDTQVPDGQPADPDANALWTTDMRFRLGPTLHLTETLRVHSDIDFLHNVSLGADRRHHYFFDGQPSANDRLFDSRSGSFGPVHVREAYGEIDAFFGTISAGRMLDDWGLGIFANDGKCTDCDWGDQVDRIAFQTGVWELNARLTYDLADSGVGPDTSGFDHGFPHQQGRLDHAHQWTAALFHSPVSREDHEQRLHQLRGGDPVYNGGLYFMHRIQNGQFPGEFNADDPADPVYRGMNMVSLSPWAQLQWEPEPGHNIRLELEALGSLGQIDNVTDQPVGFDDTENGNNGPDVNCFDGDARDANPQACRTDQAGDDTDKFVQQYGLAAETEFNFDSPVTFGVNGGFATGGDTENWGYGADAGDRLDFARFSPDYHVDLILFREVIGTVTNAYYANPYVNAKFFDSGAQHMEIQLDGIASRAFERAGTPGDSPWLGLELDASLRYIAGNDFVAALDGGILFPFAGLAARDGGQRLNAYGDPGLFPDDRSPSLGWTVQGRLSWEF